MADDTQLWTQEYNRTIDETASVFDVQDEIAQRVSEELGVSLVGREKKAPPTESMEAWTAYLAAVEIVGRPFHATEDRARAIQMLQRATQRDPDFAVAWAMLSELHTYQWQRGNDRTAGRLTSALAAVEEALRLAPDLPEAHRARGYYLYFTGVENRTLAFRELELAAEGLPNDSQVFEYLAALRPRLDKVAKAQAITEAFTYLGKPYDYDFDFATDHALVCTELVWRAYRPREDKPGLDFDLVDVAVAETMLFEKRLKCATGFANHFNQ